MWLGIFLMFAPGLFNVNIERPMADINHLGGALSHGGFRHLHGGSFRRGRYLNLLQDLHWQLPPGSPAIFKPALPLSIYWQD